MCFDIVTSVFYLLRQKMLKFEGSLHFQYFSQYSCSSQQGSLLHYSNTTCYAQLSYLPIKFCRNTSKGPYHYRDNSQFSQSSDLSLKSWYFSTFSFFFLYSYISWYSNINNYPLLFFLVNNYQVRSSIRLSHWILMSHSILTSSFSAAPSGTCSYHFSLCSNLFFLKISQ